jgi:hypothetical protein
MRIAHAHIDAVPLSVRELCGSIVAEKAVRNFNLQTIMIKDEIMFIELLDGRDYFRHFLNQLLILQTSK